MAAREIGAAPQPAAVAPDVAGAGMQASQGGPVRMSVVAACVLMLLTALATWLLTPTRLMSAIRPAIDLEKVVPHKIGEWTMVQGGPLVQASPDVQQMINTIYRQVLSRTYVDAQGRAVMLSIAYGGDQSDGLKVHRPEVCYEAQGFHINNASRGQIAVRGTTLPVKRLVATVDRRIEPITYWMMMGDIPTISGFDQKLAQIHYSLEGLIPEGMLVRVSSIDADTGRGFEVQERFVADLAQSLPPADIVRFFGRPVAP